VSLQVPFEQRLTDLQAQIDQLSLTLQFWRQTQDHLQPMERRLSRLTEECAEILDRWKTTGERHAQAVDELETRLVGWSEIEARLQQETSERLRVLERSIESEWSVLRHLHEEPVKELRDQAASLTEICTAAAGSAQTGLERAEARLALLEQDIHRKLDEMTLEIRGAVSQLRLHGSTMAIGPGPAAPWPLEGVARLHEQLREGAAPLDAAAAANTDIVTSQDGMAGSPGTLARRLPPRQEAEGATVDVSAPSAEVPAEAAGARDSLIPASAGGRALAAAVGVVLIAAIVLAIAFYRQVGEAAARAAEAQQDAQRTAAAATTRVEESRKEAAAQIAEAREAALKAQIVSDVLAAPDLLRFNLEGGDETGRLSAHLLLSRTRGLVFSGSRLPAPAAGSTYQIWLLSGAAPMSAGTFVPDPSGRVTVATDNPRLPPRVVGVVVTTEPSAGSKAPTGPPILARAAQ
jgi:hypothetical protein